MMKTTFLVGLVLVVSLTCESATAKLNKKTLQRDLAGRSAVISSIENKILRNKTQLNVLHQKLAEIEATRLTHTRAQKSAHSAFIRLIRRPDNMPLVAGLDLVRGEKIVSDLQNRNVRRLNQLASRNAAISQLTADIQQQQKALRRELKKRRKAQKEIEFLLAQKKKTRNKKWEARTKALTKGKKNASALISAIIATEFSKNYGKNAKRGGGRGGSKNGAGGGAGGDFFSYPGAGTIKTHFGEKNAAGIHALGLSFEMLPEAHIVAPAGGLVVFAGTFRNYGKTIILAVPGEYHILLAGLVRLDVRVGDAVFPSELLGVMPARKKKNPILYLELRHLSRPINPEPLLTRIKNSTQG